MTKSLRRLLVLAALAGIALPALADPYNASIVYGTMADFYVGAVPKTSVTGLGQAPTVTTIAAAGAAQTIGFGAYGTNAYDITLTANLTITVASPTLPAGQRQSILLTVRNPTGGYTLTLPTMKWNNAGTTAPTWTTTAGYTYQIEIITTDGGTTLFAR